jgi:RNA polymerase sigma-70 factor (ECF subfamily)
VSVASDEKLMLAFKAGEVRAFEQLVQRHRQPVFNFLLRLTGEPTRAEDLLQETWLKVVRGARGYEAKARFTTWLFTLARNLALDSARRERLRKAQSLDEPAGEGRALGESLPAGDPQPDRAAADAALRPVLQAALARLPTEQLEVFLLREYHGISFKEIASITGVPENTVKSRMRYALEGLRRTLAESGIDGEAAQGPERSLA